VPVSISNPNFGCHLVVRLIYTTISPVKDYWNLRRLYHKEDNHMLIFCVFSTDRNSNISQKYILGNFWEYFKRLRKRSIWLH
jgi:hypothetical protein